MIPKLVFYGLKTHYRPLRIVQSENLKISKIHFFYHIFNVFCLTKLVQNYSSKNVASEPTIHSRATRTTFRLQYVVTMTLIHIQKAWRGNPKSPTADRLPQVTLSAKLLSQSIQMKLFKLILGRCYTYCKQKSIFLFFLQISTQRAVNFINTSQ